jgi:nucleoid DNA-binding protein
MTEHLKTMTTDQLVREISHLEPDNLPVEVVRRCLDLLVELVMDETKVGRRVELSHFGTFSPGVAGGILFETAS